MEEKFRNELNANIRLSNLYKVCMYKVYDRKLSHRLPAINYIISAENVNPEIFGVPFDDNNMKTLI